MIIILLIIVLVFVYYINIKAEYLDIVSKEAIEHIASVYADISGTVSFNNAIITNNANVKNMTVTKNLDINGNIISNGDKSYFKSLNIDNLNANNIRTKNNLGMRRWKFDGLLCGEPDHTQITDPDGNTYSGSEWVIYAGDAYYNGFFQMQTYIEPTSNTWYIQTYNSQKCNSSVSILAIPVNYFDKNWINYSGNL